MKRLSALLLTLCLLCSPAWAEEAAEEAAVALELNWSAYSRTAGDGTAQRLEIDGLPGLIYWVPGGMEAVDVSAMDPETAPRAAWQTPDGARTLTVTVLTVTGPEDYLLALDANGADQFLLIVTNGITAVSCVHEERDLDILVVPVAEETLAVFTFSPLEGDSGWEAAKTAVVASIRYPE